MLAVLLIQLCNLITTLTRNQNYSISPNNSNQYIFVLDEYYISDGFSKIAFPNMSYQLGVLYILAFTVCDDIFTEPETH